MNASEFKQRFLPLNARLYQTAFLLLGNEDDAKDVVQDAYLKLWDKRDSLNNIYDDQGYCMRVVRNLCLDRLRTVSPDIVDKPPEELPIISEDDTSSGIERNETARLIKQCIARLPAQQQQVIKLRELGGYSMQEIGEATGLNAVNVRVVLSRARKALRNQLQTILSS